ncbi:MAG: hypothetical protein GTO03_11785 [Planctomycetales bacterium]|nr:hypothetical protein [Planctomycetales bacterium]
MTHTQLSFALLLLLALDLPASTSADEAVEPPLTYEVTVGEQTATIAEGQTGQLDGTFTNPAISVTLQPHRVFSCQGITFKYPRAFTFEADVEDPEYKTWTLDGTDFQIMVMVLQAPLTAAQFAENMIDQLGRDNVTIVKPPATITLGQEKLSGTSLQVNVEGHQMATDIYRLASPLTATKLLIFQDILDDAGKPSAEATQTIAQLKASFSLQR